MIEMRGEDAISIAVLRTKNTLRTSPLVALPYILQVVVTSSYSSVRIVYYDGAWLVIVESKMS